MTNRFQSALQTNIPAAVTHALPAGKLAAFQNPQVLLAPGVTDQLQRQFAAFGPQGQALFQQFVLAIRTSLATAITSLFLVSMGAMVLAFVSTLFLKQIPLRKGNHPGTEAVVMGSQRRNGFVAGLTLALVAEEAQRPDASPQIAAHALEPRRWAGAPYVE